MGEGFPAPSINVSPMAENKNASLGGLAFALKPGSEGRLRQTWRVTIIFFTSAIALAGFRPFGQAFAQFMIVWQR